MQVEAVRGFVGVDPGLWSLQQQMPRKKNLVKYIAFASSDHSSRKTCGKYLFCDCAARSIGVMGITRIILMPPMAPPSTAGAEALRKLEIKAKTHEQAQ